VRSKGRRVPLLKAVESVANIGTFTPNSSAALLCYRFRQTYRTRTHCLFTTRNELLVVKLEDFDYSVLASLPFLQCNFAVSATKSKTPLLNEVLGNQNVRHRRGRM
jgi:hypothetical protein